MTEGRAIFTVGLEGRCESQSHPIIVDLFCGAGGMTTGALHACDDLGLSERRVVAVDHWPIAIETHSRNHPEVLHACDKVGDANPNALVPGGHVDLLIAAPECTHHSNARGGKPMDDQSRAMPWDVNHWLTRLDVDCVLIENVREFVGWGPLGGSDRRPIADQKGQYFDGWVGSLEALGYTCEWRFLCAADYGDATTRQRFFMICRRGHRGISWPSPTHAKTPVAGMGSSDRRPWRPAREIIRWDVPGASIYERKRPLAPNTCRRIFAGLRKYSGLSFFVPVTHDGNEQRVRPIDEPVPTLDTSNRLAVVSPYRPLPTVCANYEHYALARPFLVNMKGQSDAADIDAPCPTITAHARHLGLLRPFVVKYNSTGGAYGVGEPLDTISTRDRFALVAPELVPQMAGQGAVIGYLDILFRMLLPEELAAAHSFPKTYSFAGSKDAQVKQIGNSVPNELARALVRECLRSKIEIVEPEVEGIK